MIQERAIQCKKNREHATGGAERLSSLGDMLAKVNGARIAPPRGDCTTKQTRPLTHCNRLDNAHICLAKLEWSLIGSSRPMTVTQEQLFRQQGVKPVGSCGGAHSRPQLLLVNGRNPGHYCAKCYLPNSPYMMVAEVICADLASRLGLPIPARRRIEYDDNVWLGFQWMPEDYKPVMPEMLDKLVNPEVIPSILAFDVFVCNWDRAEDRNMIVQKVAPTLDMYQLFIIDHSVALGGTSNDMVAWLAQHKDTERYLRAPMHLLRRIESLDDFEPFLSKLESLDAAEISSIVNSVPGDWRPRQNDRTELLSGFLVRRTGEMRELLVNASHCFPSIDA